MDAVFSAVGAIPATLCREIISRFEVDTRKVESHVFASTREDIRGGVVVVMDGDEHWTRLREDFYKSLEPHLSRAARRNPGLLAMLGEPYLFTIPRVERISPEGGFRWHVDTIHQDARFLTVLCYLNDVLEGGQTEFLKQDMLVQPSEGAALFFPPFWTHVHRGLPPVGQAKYTAAFFVAAASGAEVVTAAPSLQAGPV